MTCTHISQSRIKLNDLVGKLRDSSSLVYEEIGPLADPETIKTKKEGVFSVKYWSSWTEKKYRIIKQKKVEEKINEVDNLLNSCNCYANEVSKGVSESNRRNDLINSHREERKNLQSQIDGIKSEYKEIINNQNSLIETERKETSLVKKENSDLQRLLGLSEGQARQLEVQLADKTNELNQNKQALEKLSQAFKDLLVSNATFSTEARVVKEQLDWTKGRITVGDTRIENLEDKLDQKQKETDELRKSLTNLQITYKTETQTKDNKIKQQEKEIKLLESKAGQSQEKFSNEREHSKEGKLEEFATQFGVSLQQLDSLRKYYERLIVARKNYNQTNITVHEGNIMTIKQEMLNSGINIGNIQKICRKCEKLAEVRFELEGIRKQQYQAQQEQPPK